MEKIDKIIVVDEYTFFYLCGIIIELQRKGGV